MTRNAGVAQLVERNLAKVEVESSRLFSRSKVQNGKHALPIFVRKVGAIANRLCNGLQIRVAQFDSGSRLQKISVAYRNRVDEAYDCTGFGLA